MPLNKSTTYSTSQEEYHTEILVGKIVSSRPDVILVGKSISRYAQELLLENGIVVMQHIKPQLLQRIARLVGARILSSVVRGHIYPPFTAV